MIDPATVGDPELMRALARELQGRAELVRGLAAPAVDRLAEAVFEGPAATRLRGDADQLAGAVRTAAEELEGIASSLLVDASLVEARNDELRRQAEAAARADADAARAAAATREATAPSDPGAAAP